MTSQLHPRFGSSFAPPSSFGVFYPKGGVVAVIDDAGQAAAAVQSLGDVGIAPESIDVLNGRDLLQVEETLRLRRSTLQRIGGLLSKLIGDDGRYEEEYVEEARKGHRTLVVHTPPGWAVESIRRILADHHAHHARYYRSAVVEDLLQDVRA